MLLVVDVGNTQTVIGVYRTTETHAPDVVWRIATDKADASDDLFAKIYPLMCLADVDPQNVDRAVCASVVPALGEAWCRMLEGSLDADVVTCTAASAMEAGLFEADYPTPLEIGADRVADAIAIKKLYGGPAIVVDFGTATNFEIIDGAGCFVGGIIAPGIMTGANALYANATRLAATNLKDPPSVIGKSTETALASGIILGEAARVDGLIARAMEELGVKSVTEGGDCTVVATGGLASLVAEHSCEITEVSSELTLIGLRLLAESM